MGTQRKIAGDRAVHGSQLVNQAPICVVGMHRSGTSLTTRMLAALGVDIGPPGSMLPPDPLDNREGYQEQEPILQLNDELLRALGGHASEPPEPAAGWEHDAAIQPFADRGRKLIAELYGPAPWAFKDPRASLLLPFWREVVPGLRVLICVRNPLEVAESMDRRGGPYEFGHWLEVWRRHTFQAFAGSETAARDVVVYEDLIKDPRGTARRVGRFASGHEPSDAQLATAAALPDPSARRSAIDDRVLLADPRVPSAIAQEYIDLREWEGSIDSRSSNPITTQPSAALLDSRHGS